MKTLTSGQVEKVDRRAGARMRHLTVVSRLTAGQKVASKRENHHLKRKEATPESKMTGNINQKAKVEGETRKAEPMTAVTRRLEQFRTSRTTAGRKAPSEVTLKQESHPNDPNRSARMLRFHRTMHLTLQMSRKGQTCLRLSLVVRVS